MTDKIKQNSDTSNVYIGRTKFKDFKIVLISPDANNSII